MFTQWRCFKSKHFYQVNNFYKFGKIYMFETFYIDDNFLQLDIFEPWKVLKSEHF
jgi:hypothetical protein